MIDIELLLSRVKDLREDERDSVLESESQKVEHETYAKQLTPEEMIDRKDQFTKLSVELAKIDADFTEVKEQFKGKIKPLKENIKNKLQTIRMGAEEITGKVFYIPDYELGKMHVVTADGVLLQTRLLFPHERQFHIQPLKNAK